MTEIIYVILVIIELKAGINLTTDITIKDKTVNNLVISLFRFNAIIVESVIKKIDNDSKTILGVLSKKVK